MVINSNKQDLVDKAIGKISKTAPGAHLIAAVADLSTQQGVQDLVRKVPAVDILVNSVGFYLAKDFLEISDEDWDQMMNLNFMSGVRLSRASFQARKRTAGAALFSSQANPASKSHTK